nr:MAG TPA: Matrixin [Crassvirales sp.]
MFEMMKLIMKYIRNLILFIWQLPQHLLAILYIGYLVMMCKDLGVDSRYKQAIVIPCVMRGAVTLGCYVFVGLNSEYRKTVKHELGHTIQSKILGPLYLIVIGIPSITYCGLRRIFPSLRKKNYYNFYTERWANNLSEKCIK